MKQGKIEYFAGYNLKMMTMRKKIKITNQSEKLIMSTERTLLKDILNEINRKILILENNDNEKIITSKIE